MRIKNMIRITMLCWLACASCAQQDLLRRIAEVERERDIAKQKLAGVQQRKILIEDEKSALERRIGELDYDRKEQERRHKDQQAQIERTEKELKDIRIREGQLSGRLQEKNDFLDQLCKDVKYSYKSKETGKLISVDPCDKSNIKYQNNLKNRQQRKDYPSPSRYSPPHPRQTSGGES